MDVDILFFIVNKGISYLVFFINEIWWFVLCLALVSTARSTWLYWRQLIFKKGLRSAVLLELRIPREITKNPRAMDHVVRSLHSLRNSPGDIIEKYWDGEVTRWFSLEIVSLGGEVHFYIRCPQKQRGIVEAALLSYYPDVEVVESDDYMERLPSDIESLHKEGLEMFGGEMVLAKPEVYPIKTYIDYEVPNEDTQFIDPMSSTLEILGNIKQDDFVAIQFNIAPGPPDWGDEFEDILEKLRPGGKVLPDSSNLSSLMSSPGERALLQAAENKLATPIFNTLIRIIYTSPKETYFDVLAREGLKVAFNQYSSVDMNFFKYKSRADTRTKYWEFPPIFPRARKLVRQKRLYCDFKNRNVPEQEWMGKILSSSLFGWNNHSKFTKLSSTEIATLFHPPTYVVLTAPHIPRVESRKAGPPSGLPIFSSDSTLDRFE